MGTLSSEVNSRDESSLIVGIVGLGLIGGSVGLGLIESGFAERIVGFDTSAVACAEAMHRKVVHAVFDDFGEAEAVDLWVIATPPMAVPTILRQLADRIPAGAAITDCASVKALIQAEVPEAFLTTFVGGHPMAGNETGSISNARGDLFRDAHWLLTPHDDTDVRALDRVRKMVYALDAIPVCLPPVAHDEHAAWLSHVPHLLAAMLTLRAEDLKLPHLGAGSWRDLTRVAGSEPELWTEILSMNGEALDEALAHIESWVGRLRMLIANDDQAEIQQILRAALEAKRKQALLHAQVQSHP